MSWRTVWRQKPPLPKLPAVSAIYETYAGSSLHSYRECMANAMRFGPPILIGTRLTDQFGAERLGDSLGLRMHLQLLIDILHVKGNGVEADTHGGGRRFIVVAFHQHF